MLARMKLTRVLLVALACALQSGCAGPTFVVEQYAGPKRDAETIAIVRFIGDDDVRLVVIDGERADVNLDEDARLHVEVLPGDHTVGVVSRARPEEPLQVVSFRAAAGKVYRVFFVGAGPNTARVFEVDPGSDAKLADVTLARPDERQQPTPRAPRGLEEPPSEPLELAAPDGATGVGADAGAEDAADGA
jgi:hypothetical protein